MGIGAIHGIPRKWSLPFTMLVSTLTNRHPCHAAVAKTAGEFAQMFSFLESRSLPVSEDEMWWKDIQNASFPAAEVSTSTKYIYYWFNPL